MRRLVFSAVIFLTGGFAALPSITLASEQKEACAEFLLAISWSRFNAFDHLYAVTLEDLWAHLSDVSAQTYRRKDGKIRVIDMALVEYVSKRYQEMTGHRLNQYVLIQAAVSKEPVGEISSAIGEFMDFKR